MKFKAELQKLSLARRKRTCFCSVGSLAMCFVLEYYFMLQYLGSAPHAPILRRLTAGRIPTVSDLSRWGRVLVWFWPPSQIMRYGCGSSIRPKLGEPKRRSGVIQIVRVTRASKKNDLPQPCNSKKGLMMMIYVTHSEFFLKQFLFGNSGRKKTCLLFLNDSLKSIEHNTLI